MLTDRTIKNLKPTDKHQFIADGNGLYLRVHPTGAKTWVYRSRQGGKARWLSLGNYPTLSLVDARRRVLDKPEAPAPSDEAITFGIAYNEYYERVAAKHYRRPDIIHQRVQANLLPELRSRALTDITRVELTTLLNKIVDRGAPAMANRTLDDLKHILGYAVERGWLETNVAGPITRKVVGGKESPRDVVVSFDGLKSFLQLLLDDFHGKRGMAPATVVAIYLCMLTGQRASEVLYIMRHWKGERLITLPRTKTTPMHKVYLASQARVALKLCRGEPLPRDHRVLSHALRRLEVGFTPHDLRRTMATRLSDMGIAPHVIEKMLNHQMTGVMAVYNRAEYLDERRHAWRLWGYKIAALRRAARQLSSASCP